MTPTELRLHFKVEKGINWENCQGEPDIEYVEWLESNVIQTYIAPSGGFCYHLNMDRKTIVNVGDFCGKCGKTF